MQSRLRRIIALASVNLTVMLTLTACVQVEVGSEFEPDGSALHSLTTTVDRTLLDGDMLGGELEGEIDLDEIEQEGEARGFDVEQIDTADRVGVRLSTSIDDNEDIGAVLTELLAASGGGPPPPDVFQGGFSESGGFGGSTYRFELTVDGDALFEQGVEEEFDEDLEDEFDMEIGMDMMRQFVDLTYTVAMPGEITDHNGTDLGGGRVQWDIPLQGTQTFFAESEESGGFSVLLIAGVAIGVLAVALLAIGSVILLRGQKSPTAPDAPS